MKGIRRALRLYVLAIMTAACLVLVISKQLSLALNIAVFALVLLYCLHSLAFLMLPRWNQPSWPVSLVVSASVCRWSPGRAGSRRTRAGRPASRSRRRRISQTLAASPPPTL